MKIVASVSCSANMESLSRKVTAFEGSLLFWFSGILPSYSARGAIIASHLVDCAFCVHFTLFIFRYYEGANSAGAFVCHFDVVLV